MSETKTNARLPSLKMLEEALGALGELFDGLPTNRRPLHTGNRGDVRRVLEMVKKYLVEEGKGANAETAVVASTTGAADATEEEVAVMSIQRIIQQILGLTQDQRVELIEELGACMCVGCGATEGEDHRDDCTIDEDEEDEEGEEEEQEVAQ